MNYIKNILDAIDDEHTSIHQMVLHQESSQA